MAAGKASKHPAAWSRYFRRLMRPFLSLEEKQNISRLIEEMEGRTTGEIHVHVAGRVRGKNMLEAAEKLFYELSLDRTDGRNAVLILISHLDHRFAIWGDQGIHARAGKRLWVRAGEVLLEHFKERRYPEGVEACVREVGAELAVHFPKTDGRSGKNQISNDVTES